MTDYAVVCDSGYHASILFHKLSTWLYETHVSNCYTRRIPCGYLIELRDMRITILFTSEAYFEITRRGFRGTCVNEHDVEKFLDEHKEDINDYRKHIHN